VNPYDEDLQSYRKLLLTPEKQVEKEKPKPAKVAKPSREKIQAMRSDVRKNEERVKKINDMRDKLAKKLADPALYEDAKAGELATWNKKYAEVMDAHERAETMWMAALERLEKAEKA
jgi:ATP-binding cassette subfamily F protein 3